MSAFDDLTLGEVEEISATCLGGKQMSDATVDPLQLAGAVMWMTTRKDDPGLSWDAFKQKTTMGAIKEFGQAMEAEEAGDSENP